MGIVKCAENIAAAKRTIVSKLSELDPALVPVECVEDIVNRAVSGFPNRKLHQIIISPEGQFFPFDQPRHHEFAISVQEVHSRLSAEELSQLRDISEYLYKRKVVRTTYAGMAAVVMFIVAVIWKTMRAV